MPRLTADERGIAIGLLRANLSARDIGRQLNCSHVAVLRLPRRYRLTNSIVDLPRPGRPRATTQRQERFIRRHHLSNPFEPAARTPALLPGRVRVSERTVRRRLVEGGLAARRLYVGPVLNAHHRQQRLHWAQRHLRMTRRDWRAVLFSDESRFSLSMVDGRIRVWRRARQRCNQQNVHEHVPFGGGSIMVFGAFSSHHRTPLHVFRQNVTVLLYRDEILQPLVVQPIEHVWDELRRRELARS